jgi:hypothetical protein
MQEPGCNLAEIENGNQGQNVRAANNLARLTPAPTCKPRAESNDSRAGLYQISLTEV